MQTPEAFAKVLDTSKPKTVQQILAESDDPASQAAAATHGPIPTKSPPASPVPSENWTIPCAPDRSADKVPHGMVVVDSQGRPLTPSQNSAACIDDLKHDMHGQHTSTSDELQGVEVCHIHLASCRRVVERQILKLEQVWYSVCLQIIRCPGA